VQDTRVGPNQQIAPLQRCRQLGQCRLAAQINRLATKPSHQFVRAIGPLTDNDDSAILDLSQ